jgi:hypothetical protein
MHVAMRGWFRPLPSPGAFSGTLFGWVRLPKYTCPPVSHAPATVPAPSTVLNREEVERLIDRRPRPCIASCVSTFYSANLRLKVSLNDENLGLLASLRIAS